MKGFPWEFGIGARRLKGLNDGATRWSKKFLEKLYHQHKVMTVTGKTRNSAIAGKPREAFRGQSRSPNMVPTYAR